MQELKELIIDLDHTSEILKRSSEYMKRLEKEVEYKDLCYRKAQKVLLALYMKGKADPHLMEQMPEVWEYMREGEENNDPV